MKRKGPIQGLFIKDGVRVIGVQLGFLFTFAEKVVRKLGGFVWFRNDGVRVDAGNLASLVAQVLAYRGKKATAWVASIVRRWSPLLG